MYRSTQIYNVTFEKVENNKLWCSYQLLSTGINYYQLIWTVLLSTLPDNTSYDLMAVIKYGCANL